MNNIKKQSTFTRVCNNEAKMGAYYTDLKHCEWISQFLEFAEEVCCLDPCIGNGEAILTVIGEKLKNQKIKIYGVELNQNTFDELRNNPKIEQCINADFLNDVLISHNAFSFTFINPPYGTQENKVRYEVEFLKKIKPYLTREAVIVYILPQYVAKEQEFQETWSSSFNTKFIYKFHEKEYVKYQQIVLFGIKKNEDELIKKDEKEILSILSDKEKIPLLPKNYTGKKIIISKSKDASIDLFMTSLFCPENAEKVIINSPLQKMVQDKINVPTYLIDNLGRPPIIPSEGHMYLLAISGAGQGLVGKEQNGDLHLQRGVTKTMVRSEYITDKNGKIKEVEIKYPQIYYNIIEGNGNIRSLMS